MDGCLVVPPGGDQEGGAGYSQVECLIGDWHPDVFWSWGTDGCIQRDQDRVFWALLSWDFLVEPYFWKIFVFLKDLFLGSRFVVTFQCGIPACGSSLIVAKYWLFVFMSICCSKDGYSFLRCCIVFRLCVCVFDVVWRLRDGIGLFMACFPGRRFHWLFFAIRHLLWISCGCWASCLVYVLIETLCF